MQLIEKAGLHINHVKTGATNPINDELNWSELLKAPEGDGVSNKKSNQLISSNTAYSETAYLDKDAAYQEEENALLKYITTLWRRKWLIIFVALFVLVLSSLIIFNIKPTYLAYGTLLINSEDVIDLGNIEDVFTDSNQNIFFRTQEKILTSRELAGRVINELGLATNPDFNPSLLKDGGLMTSSSADDGGWYKNLQQIVPLSEEQSSEWINWLVANLNQINDEEGKPEDLTEEDLIDIFLEDLSVALLRNSQIFEVYFKSSDAELAASVVNTLMDNYIIFDDEKRLQSQNEIYQRIQNRLDKSNQQLEEAEKKLQDFRESEKFIDSYEAGASSLAMRELSALDSDYFAALQLVNNTQRIYDEARNFSSKDISPTAPLPRAFRNDAILESLIVEQTNSLEKLKELKALYTDSHPNILSEQIAFSSKKAIIDGRIQTITLQIKDDLDSAIEKMRLAKQSLDESEAKVLAIDRKKFELSRLEREVNIHRELSQKLATRLRESNAATDVRTQNVNILDVATTPSTPAEPKRKKLLIVAFLASLFLGILVALTRDFLSQTFTSVDDIEQRLRVPVLGILPKLKRRLFSFKSLRPIHFFQDKPHSIFSEAFRSIRTNVLLTKVDSAQKIILITSSTENEGKSSVSLNLARALSESSKTIIIDADMRNPTIGKEMGLKKSMPGLSHFAANLHDLSDCIYQDENTSLSYMPAGIIPPNPLDLINSQRFQLLLRYLTVNFDHIVIDSPPLVVSDGLLLSRYASGVILVVRFGKTKFKQAQESMKQLIGVQAPIMGTVLNEANMKLVGYKLYSYK